MKWFKTVVVIVVIIGGLSILFSYQKACNKNSVRENKIGNKSTIIENLDKLKFQVPTKGGLGGIIIKVTNLNASGPGSLKEALATNKPRIVVFEVGGVIDLQGNNLGINYPYLTIAGQTAPSPGITIIKGGIIMKTHDVILQHIAVRPGDLKGESLTKIYEPDGLTTVGKESYNIWIDHCSFTWSIDENLSTSGAREKGKTSHNIFFTNNIIGEGLFKSRHSKGAHSMGTLVHDFVENVSIIGNLFYCNNRRNPLFKSYTTGTVANNFIYNPGERAIEVTWVNQEMEALKIYPQNGKVSIVGNVLERGSDSQKGLEIISGKGDFYIEDNIIVGDLSKKNSITYSKQQNILTKKPHWIKGFKAIKASKVKDYVLKNVGARPLDRDKIDERIIQNILDRKGKIINSQEEVGGYPAYETKFRTLNVPTENFENWLSSYTKEVE